MSANTLIQKFQELPYDIKKTKLSNMIRIWKLSNKNKEYAELQTKLDNNDNIEEQTLVKTYSDIINYATKLKNKHKAIEIENLNNTKAKLNKLHNIEKKSIENNNIEALLDKITKLDNDEKWITWITEEKSKGKRKRLIFIFIVFLWVLVYLRRYSWLVEIIENIF